MVEFNPAKISPDRFQSIIKEIETLDDQHELEIVNLNLTKEERLEGEESGYAIHVREKPNFWERLFRILWRTPDTVRVSNVGQFLMSFVEKNQEVFYKLDERVAKGFIDKTSHHFSNYPEIEKTISVAFGIIVHQQHMIQENNIDKEKLTTDNINLTKAAKEAKEKLEKYEENHGTLTKILENIASLSTKIEEYKFLNNRSLELQKQVEESTTALQEIEAKNEVALLAQTKAEQEAAVISQQTEISKKELDAAKSELAKTKQESEDTRETTKQQLQQALEWADEVEKEHKMLQTEARNTVRQQYMVQEFQKMGNELAQEMKQQKESIEKFKEEKIREAKAEADKIILQAKQEAQEIKTTKDELKAQKLQKKIEELEAKLNPKKENIEGIRFWL